MYGPMTFSETVESDLATLAAFQAIILAEFSPDDESEWMSRANIGATLKPRET